MTRTMCLSRSILLALLCCAVYGRAHAAPLTFTGNLAADNSTFSYIFTSSTAQTYDFFTTSYAGGRNANGSMTTGGGFVPVLTLFSYTSGSVIGFSGAGGACRGGAHGDLVTGLCDDANFLESLAPGKYDLVLSEFPNVPTGGLRDGFLAGGDSSFTGTNCGERGHKFLETDVAPCVQRSSAYSVNINSAPTSPSPVPEPATWLLVLPGAAMALMARRQLA